MLLIYQRLKVPPPCSCLSVAWLGCGFYKMQPEWGCFALFHGRVASTMGKCWAQLLFWFASSSSPLASLAILAYVQLYCLIYKVPSVISFLLSLQYYAAVPYHCERAAHQTLHMYPYFPKSCIATQLTCQFLAVLTLCAAHSHYWSRTWRNLNRQIFVFFPQSEVHWFRGTQTGLRWDLRLVLWLLMS